MEKKWRSTLPPEKVWDFGIREQKFWKIEICDIILILNVVIFKNSDVIFSGKGDGGKFARAHQNFFKNGKLKNFLYSQTWSHQKISKTIQLSHFKFLMRVPPSTKSIQFFKILPLFRSILVISGNIQTKFFGNHSIYDQDITNFIFSKFLLAHCQNSSIWNFEFSHFYYGRSRVNFFHKCARNTPHAPKFFVADCISVSMRK